MNILFISHACLRYEVDDVILLTDPWITDDPIYCDSIYKFPHPNESIKNSYKDANWLYISHSHEDHFHIPSLQLFPKNINIIIPNFKCHNQGRRGNLMEDILRSLGFRNIHILDSWEILDISSTLSFQLIPSSKSRFFDWENSGLLIKYKDKIVLNMNDNVADKELCEKILEFHKKIDIYFIQSSSVTTYPACFKYTEEEKKNIISQKQNDYKYQDVVIDILKPEFLIPYAGDLGWFGKQIEFNYLARNSPINLINYIRSKGLRSFHMESGDSFILKNESFLFKNLLINDWKNYKSIISNSENYYKKIIKENELKLQFKANDNFELNLSKYIYSINNINKFSDAFIDSKAMICYKINREKYSPLYVTVSCKQNRYLYLEIVQKISSKIAQIHITNENTWLNIMKGNYMLSQIAWRSEIDQKFMNSEVRNLIFAIGYHIDGDNRSKEIKLRPYYQIK